MIKTMTALAVTAVVAGAALSTMPEAQARPRGGAIAAGVIGGIAAGAAIAAGSNYYGNGYYAQAPSYGYYDAAPAYGYYNAAPAYGGAYAYEPGYSYPSQRYPNSYNDTRQGVGK